MRAWFLILLFMFSITADGRGRGRGRVPHGASPEDTTTPAFFHPLTYSGYIQLCQLLPNCKLQVLAQDPGIVVGYLPDGGTATIQNSTANGFEDGPMVSGSGSAVKVAKDITDATAPYISAADAQTVLGTTFWSSDHTVMCAAMPTSTATSGPVVLSHGVGAAGFDGFYLQVTSTVTQARYNGGGVQQLVQFAGGPISKWVVVTIQRSSGFYVARMNGGETSAAVTTTADNPLSQNLYFGRYDSTGSAMRGPLYGCLFFDTALSSGTKALYEAMLLKGLATRPADTYVTTVRASAAFDVYADGYVHASGDNVRIPHSTKGLQSFSAQTNLWTHPVTVCSATSNGTPICTPAVASGPFSRYTGGAEAVELVDDNGAANESKITAISNPSNAAYYGSCYVAAGQTGTVTDKFDLQLINTGGSRSGTCTCAFTGLTASYERKSCGPCTMAGSPTALTMYVSPSGTAADTGSVRVSYCDLFLSDTLRPVSPITTAIAADVHNLDSLASSLPAPSGNFEISFDFTPNWADKSSTSFLLDTRDASGLNGVAIWVSGTETLNFRVANAATTATATSASLAWTSGTTYRIKAVGSGGFLNLYRNGTLVAGPTAYTGTTHSSVRVGSNRPSSTEQADGWFKNECVGRQGACPRRRRYGPKRDRRRVLLRLAA